MAKRKTRKLKIAKNWQSDAATRKAKLVAAIKRQKAAKATSGGTDSGTESATTTTSTDSGESGSKSFDIGQWGPLPGYTSYGSYMAPSNLKGKALERYKAIIGESKYNRPIEIQTAGGGVRYEIAHPGGGPHTRITDAQAKAANAAYKGYFGKKSKPRYTAKRRP